MRREQLRWKKGTRKIPPWVNSPQSNCLPVTCPSPNLTLDGGDSPEREWGGFSGHWKKVTSFFNSLPSRNNVSKLFIISCSRGYYNSKLCSRFEQKFFLQKLEITTFYVRKFRNTFFQPRQDQFNYLFSRWKHRKKLTRQAGIIMVIINVFQYQWGNKVRFVHTFWGIKSTKIDSRHCIFILYEYFNLE